MRQFDVRFGSLGDAAGEPVGREPAEGGVLASRELHGNKPVVVAVNLRRAGWM